MFGFFYTLRAAALRGIADMEKQSDAVFVSKVPALQLQETTNGRMLMMTTIVTLTMTWKRQPPHRH